MYSRSVWGTSQVFFRCTRGHTYRPRERDIGCLLKMQNLSYIIAVAVPCYSHVIPHRVIIEVNSNITPIPKRCPEPALRVWPINLWFRRKDGQVIWKGLPWDIIVMILSCIPAQRSLAATLWLIFVAAAHTRSQPQATSRCPQRYVVNARKYHNFCGDCGALNRLSFFKNEISAENFALGGDSAAMDHNLSPGVPNVFFSNILWF